MQALEDGCGLDSRLVADWCLVIESVCVWGGIGCDVEDWRRTRISRDAALNLARPYRSCGAGELGALQCL